MTEKLFTGTLNHNKNKKQLLYFLNPKSQATRYFVRLYIPFCVGTGRKPRRQVFSRRGSCRLICCDTGAYNGISFDGSQMISMMFNEERGLFVLMLNITVNNFSVISGRSHRFLGITSTFRGVNVSLIKDITRRR